MIQYVDKTFGEVTVYHTPSDTMGVWYTLRLNERFYSELVVWSFAEFPGQFSNTGFGNHTWKYKAAFFRNANVGDHKDGPLYVDLAGDDAVIALLESLGYNFERGGPVVTAEWDRPVDGLTLQDTIDINIVEGSSSTIEHTYHGEQEQ